MKNESKISKASRSLKWKIKPRYISPSSSNIATSQHRSINNNCTQQLATGSGHNNKYSLPG